MGLADADNPTADAMAAVLKHPLLLAVKFMNHQQIAVLTAIEMRQRRLLGQLGNGLEIASQKTELLSQRFAPLACRMLAVFCVGNKQPTGFLPVGSWLWT